MLIRANQLSEQTLGLKHKILLSDPEAPVVFFIHGRAGNFDLMWPFKRCLPENLNIISMQAPHPDPLGGFSWWEIGSQNSRHEIEAAFSQANAFMAHALEHYQLRNSCRLAFGFSQGAGLLSLLAQKEPSRVGAVALLAGFVIQDKSALASRNAALPDIFIAHGTNDLTVPIDKARGGAAYLQSLGFEVRMVEDAVEHKVGSGGMRELKLWTERQINRLTAR